MNAQELWEQYIGQHPHGARMDGYVSGWDSARPGVLYNAFIRGNSQMGWQHPYQDGGYVDRPAPTTAFEMHQRIDEALDILHEVQQRMYAQVRLNWRNNRIQQIKRDMALPRIYSYGTLFGPVCFVDHDNVELAWELARLQLQEDLERICGR